MNLKGLLPQDRDGLELWLTDVAVSNLLDVRFVPLLRCSIGRIAAHNVRLEYPKRMDECWGSPYPRRETLRHILDWLVASVHEDAPWLSNVDDRGRPRKLLKCSTYEDLIREADKAMAKKHAEHSKRLGPDDEQHVADLDDGYRLVRLLTPEALDLESYRMHHCAGDGAYDGKIASGWSRILSLRDRKGRPMATIELRRESNGRWEIDQIRGKHNGSPAASHLAILKPYARTADWRGRQTFWPSVIDVDGIEHDLDKIPPGTTLDQLNAARHWGEAVTLATDLTVLQHACIGHGVPAVPERLTVHGNLYLATTRQKPITLPESLQVGGSVVVWALDEIAGPIPVHLADRIETSSTVKKMGALSSLYEVSDGIEGVDYQIVRRDDQDDEVAQWLFAPR